MKKHALAALGAGLAASALLLSGCSGGGGEGETAIVYSSNNETTIGIVTDAAANRDPSLTLDVVTGSSGPLLKRIESEAAAPKADVFYGAPAATLEDYADFAAPYESPENAALPKEILDSENRWVPTNTHVVTFMTNTDQIEGGKSPASWKELTDPKWAGKVISADPEQSTTAMTALYGAYKVLGTDDFLKLAKNLEVTESSSNVYPAVAQGEYAVSIGYESNVYPYIAGEQAGVEMVYPADGTFVEYDEVMIVKDSPNPEAAKHTIDTILAKETQETNLAESFRRPIRTDIDPSEFVEFKRLEDLTVVEIDTPEDEQGRKDFLEVWKNR